MSLHSHIQLAGKNVTLLFNDMLIFNFSIFIPIMLIRILIFKKVLHSGIIAVALKYFFCTSLSEK